MIHIGSEESEQLDVIPAKIIVKKHIRYKYACKSCQECVKRAPAPFSPIDKAIATSNLLAHICTQKFDDHSPLYRQERIWQRLGVSLSPCYYGKLDSFLRYKIDADHRST